jgi:hypothetical protein
MSEAYRSMYEGSLKQARRNIGMDPNKPSCWDGYEAKGTKMKGGKSVPDCVKEDYIEYLLDNGFAEDLNSAEIIYSHMSDDWKMVIDEEAYDKMKNKRLTDGGVDGNTNYDKPPKPNKNMGGGKPQAGPDAALKAVKKMMKGKLM